MPIKLSTSWVIALNVAGWPVIHLSIAWLFTKLPQWWFLIHWPRIDPGAAEAKWCEKWLRVRSWKQRLPDGAPWLGGFGKRRLRSNDPCYLERFAGETRRAEAAHGAMLLAGTVFFLWNPLWADAVIVLYAVAANVPCIIVQRYNRVRINRLQLAIRSQALRPQHREL